MVIKLSGGKVYDPVNKVSGEVRDIYVEGGKIVAAPADGRVAQDYDVKGRVVMAGAIDPQTAVRLGKILGAQYVVFGGFMTDGKSTAVLTARTVDVETSAIANPQKVILGGSIGLRPEILSRVKDLLPRCFPYPIVVEASAASR